VEDQERTLIVQRGRIDEVMNSLITEREILIEDLEKTIPVIRDESTKRQLVKKKENAEKQLEVIKKGFIPISGGWFWNIDTNSKWGKRSVKEVIDTMPTQVREKMDEEKESGNFEKLAVSGSRRGDPLLIGRKGGKNFLIAMWVNLEGNYAIGFTVNSKRKV